MENQLPTKLVKVGRGKQLMRPTAAEWSPNMWSWCDVLQPRQVNTSIILSVFIITAVSVLLCKLRDANVVELTTTCDIDRPGTSERSADQVCSSHSGASRRCTYNYTGQAIEEGW